MTRVALITGGQQGIGLGIATALHVNGWKLAIASERPAEDQAVENALEALPGASYHQFNLAEDEDPSPLLDTVEARHGRITTLVSNAGVPAMVRGDLLQMGRESFERCMAVNLEGAFFLAQAVARRMILSHHESYRSLIFVTSVSAEMVSTERGEYCMSKAGASMMAKLFAARLASEEIGVFELRPGIIETPMTAGVKDRYDSLIGGGLVPAARWGTPEDIGRTVLPLASGDAAFATGSALMLDGGLSIPRL